MTEGPASVNGLKTFVRRYQGGQLLEESRHKLITERMSEGNRETMRKRQEELAKKAREEALFKEEEGLRLVEVDLMEREERRRRAQLGLLSLQQQAGEREHFKEESAARLKELR